MKLHKNKKKITEKRTTINELHNAKMKKFDAYYKTLPTKKEKLKKLKQKLTKKSDYYEINQLENEIEELQKEIQRMETQEDMTEYLLQTQHVFKEKSLNTEKKKVVNKSNDLLSLNAFLISETDNRKKRLLNEYLVSTGGAPVSFESEYCKTDFFCEECGFEITIDKARSDKLCTNCGYCVYWQDTSLPQWSNNVDVSKTYRYQREQYFIDHLNRFQGKENVTLPPKLIQMIFIELHKRRIHDKKSIKGTLIRKILKSLNEADYYDHINSIIKKITGEKAPQLGQEVERKLISMFNRTI